MMNIYKDYLNNIKTAMLAGDKTRPVHESTDSFDGPIQKGFSVKALRNEMNTNSLLPSLQEFANQLNLRADFSQKLGAHPDFAHLKHTNETEKHYIVSTFIDIKGSTNLFRRYIPETVLAVTDIIQKAAIHTCLIFGGYIHRLQGDGLFVYYGGKNISKEDAVNKALISTSIFSYFVKHDLKELFNEQGIENIYTRIGIDLGHDKDVIWSNAGIGEVSEVTTCSLHTSLASKMQVNAENNGIVLGDHIKNHAKSYQDLMSPVCHRTENERDRYIYEIPDEKFRYTQYDFYWFNFLKRLDFIATDLNGNLSFKKTREHQSRVLDHIKPVAILNKPYYGFQ